MTEFVFTVCLFTIVISVTCNPVAQVVPTQQYPNNQPNPYSNTVSIPANYQQTASQTNPYSQPHNVQNQAPSHPGLDGNLKHHLMSKIFANPCLQKILDPNTKLYNQNGYEIQRQPNTGSVPNVINNYFIVPPEFFNLNDTKTQGKSKSSVKRRRGSSGKKTNQIKNALKFIDDSSVETVDGPDIDTVKKPEKKRKRHKTSEKVMEEKVEINDDQEVKKAKKRKKQDSLNKVKEGKVKIPEPTKEFEEEESLEEEMIPPPIIAKNQKKRRKKPRKAKTQTDSTKDELDVASIPDKVSTKKEKIVSAPVIDNSVVVKKNQRRAKDIIKPENSSNNESHLKNIESPLDDLESTKDITENRATRNSKKEKGKKEATQRVTPPPDDIFKNFFPHMYLNNYFNPNGNYPFNFEQFYQPYLGQNNKRNRKRKNKKNEKEQNRVEPKSLPNVVEVKLKSKKKEIATTANPLNAEESSDKTQSQLDSTYIETTTQTLVPVTGIPMEIPHEVSPIQEDKEEWHENFSPDIAKTESVLTKAQLKMPPTVLDDSNEFITPELGIEDLVPNIHNNGIINDYYPIFDDDAYYNDESYYLKDLEDDRHFYATDQGHEELLNRDRRKYDRNEDYRVPNHDINDHINFRRGYKFREIDKIKELDDDEIKYVRRPHNHEKLSAQEIIPTKTEKNEEYQFQTPPLLDNPNFKTKKIEKGITNPHNSEYSSPVYTDYWAETIPKKSEVFSDAEPAEFSRLVTSDAGIRTERIPSKNIRPKKDRIETVFAKTRVVKYGVAKEESEEDTASMPEQKNEGDTKFFSDGQTTFVVAKSLGHVDDYYW